MEEQKAVAKATNSVSLSLLSYEATRILDSATQIQDGCSIIHTENYAKPINGLI